MTFTWWWGVCRSFSKEETLRRLRLWLEEFPHRSTTLDRSPRQFVKTSMREAAHYFDHRVVPCLREGPPSPRGLDVALLPLSSRDHAVLARVDRLVRPEVHTVLRYLRTCANSAGCVTKPVNLSVATPNNETSWHPFVGGRAGLAYRATDHLQVSAFASTAFGSDYRTFGASVELSWQTNSWLSP